MRSAVEPASWARRVPDALAVLAIAASLLLVWPFGEYPFGDDWAFALPLRHLLTDGHLQIVEFTPMTVVAHVAWGALVSLPFGFSFDVARISTVLLLLVEVRAVLCILEDLGVAAGVRAAAALTLVFQPVHFFQSFQFATDVPCAAWTAMSLLAYSRGLAGDKPPIRWLAAGSVFAGLAFGVRQPGILVVAAVGAYLVLCDRPLLRRWCILLACFAVPAASVAAWSAWYFGIHGSTEAYRDVSDRILFELSHVTFAGLASVFWCVCATATSFALPLALSVRILPITGARRAGAVVAAAVFAALFAVMAIGYGTVYPYMQNGMTAFGLLSPNEMIVGAREPLWPGGAGVVMGLATLVALARLAWIGAGLRGCAPAMRLSLLLASMQLAWFVATSGYVVDRHLLQMLPPLLVVVAGACGHRGVRWSVFTPLVCLSAFYAIACTHDWHAISRAAASAERDLLAQGIDPRFVDGGYAETCWQMYERSEDELARGEPASARPGDSWWVTALDRRVETRFVVSLSESMSPSRWEAALPWWARKSATTPRIDAYVPYRRVYYDSWWPRGRQTLWVLEDTRGAAH